jgi:hypothetical protein
MVFSPTYWPHLSLRGYPWYSFLRLALDHSAVRRFKSMKNPMSQSEIEPATFRLVLHCPKACVGDFGSQLKTFGTIKTHFDWFAIQQPHLYWHQSDLPRTTIISQYDSLRQIFVRGARLSFGSRPYRLISFCIRRQWLVLCNSISTQQICVLTARKNPRNRCGCVLGLRNCVSTGVISTQRSVNILCFLTALFIFRARMLYIPNTHYTLLTYFVANKSTLTIRMQRFYIKWQKLVTTV